MQSRGDGVNDGNEQTHDTETGPGLEGVRRAADVGELARRLGQPELGDRVGLWPLIRARRDWIPAGDGRDLLVARKAGASSWQKLEHLAREGR
jgi:hypothetical protein